MSYDRLSPGIQRWIDYRGWNDWTSIQSQAIPQILDGNGALIIAPTASGKTEAAILPIISEISRLKIPPIALLYVSPLRALINDQTRRAQNLLEENALKVGWWHGDLPQHARKKMLAHPPHALFTTPESIEVMLSSDGYGHGAFLGDVRFVLIDEVHAFAEDDRGAQLMSLLTRIEAEKKTPLTRIALSATVSSPASIVEWLRSSRSDAPNIPVLVDSATRGRKIGVGCIGSTKAKSGDKREEARKLSTIVRRHVEGRRAIVFVNSRSEAESLTFQLREQGVYALVHHGSIHKEERERVESTFRVEGPKVIVATSTLELGIDIGDLELVLQIGAPSTVSSLLQRMGRSGRRGDAESKCILYADTVDELAVTLAVGDLALQGSVEALHPDSGALQVLFHQVLQFLRERARADEREIQTALLAGGSFRDTDDDEFATLIGEMLEDGYLERERDWLTIGPTTEKLFGSMNYRDFYSVFETETEWTVRTDNEIIGTLSRQYPIAVDHENFIVLGGRAWRVTAINREKLVLLVEPAQRVKIPNWSSMGRGASFDVMQRAFSIICGETVSLESPALTEKLASQRADARARNWEPNGIFLSLEKNESAITTYFGSALNEYLATLLIGRLSPQTIRATPEDVRCRGVAIEPIRGALQVLLTDPEERRNALDVALPKLEHVQVGRFWPNLGPKTRINVLRRLFRKSEPYIERLEHMQIHSNTERLHT